MKKLLSLLILVATGMLAQNAPTVTGSVSGHVFDSDTNIPLVGVAVHSPEGGSYGKSVKTDSQGHYILPDLPPGKRTVNTDDGVTMISTTQPQTVMVLGGRDTSVDFHIRTFAQVSGRVLDEDGSPLPGIQVVANRREYEGYIYRDGMSRTGELQLVSVPASAVTDDRGRYLIRNLRAGRRYWIAASVPRRNALPISDAPADPQARRRAMAATYYPNANSIEFGSSILLHSQEQRDAVDIRMLKAESYCMEATLAEGGVPTNLQFLLVETAVASTQLPTSGLPGSSASSSDGKIRLCDLYPGRYRLIAARLTRFTQESIGTADFTISDKDVFDLVVTAIPRSIVAGEFVWDKRPNEVSNPSIRVYTYPSPVIQELTQRLPSSETFSLDVVAGSSYLPVIFGMDSHSYVKDITYGASSILNQPFVPSGADTKLRVMIGTDAGSITVTTLTANGQPVAGSAVIIVPVAASTESEVASTFHAGITNENGIYRKNGLPPGKYDVFATNDAPPNWIDRDQIMLIDRTPEAIVKILTARARGKIVEVRPGADASVSLSPVRMD